MLGLAKLLLQAGLLGLNLLLFILMDLKSAHKEATHDYHEGYYVD